MQEVIKHIKRLKKESFLHLSLGQHRHSVIQEFVLSYNSVEKLKLFYEFIDPTQITGDLRNIYDLIGSNPYYSTADTTLCNIYNLLRSSKVFINSSKKIELSSQPQKEQSFEPPSPRI